MAVKGIKGNTDRIRLEEHIPLDTPLRVLLDVSSICNFHCSYCVHGNGEAAKIIRQEIMPASLAKKCIDDLAAFPRKLKMLSFFDLGEPLLNKNLLDLVRYASERSVAEQLEITTNGSLLTHELSECLISAGVTLINISVYGLDSDDYLTFCKVPLNFDRFVQEISYLYCISGNAKIVIKICETTLETRERTNRFYQIFGPICDKICIEHPVPIWYDIDCNVEGDGKDIYGNQITKKQICPLPFYTMCVHVDGTVVPCCADWKGYLSIGDANTESLKSIWNNEIFQRLRKNLLKDGNMKTHPCKRCNFHECVVMDNIDPYRVQLLERLEYIDDL